MSVDYREKYKGQKGACCTCKNARDRLLTVDSGRHGNTTIIIHAPYTGGKDLGCFKRDKSVSIRVLDEPRMDLQINDCWEACE